MNRAVIDQPGLRVLVFGLLLALFLGLGLRSQISTERVGKSLQRSVQILEKDFLIDFDGAQVRLAKWGLPLPHLVVSKLRVSPRKSHCQSSQIYIDELELPLQLKHLFSRDKTIDLIRAKNVEVRLVDLETCFANEKTDKAEKKNRPQKAEASTAVMTGEDFASGSSALTSPASATNIFSQKTGTRLKEIAIDQLKVITSKNYDQPIVFKQLKFFLNYEEAKLSQVDVRSRVYAIKDSRSDIYFLISDLNAQIRPMKADKSNPEQNVETTLQLKGRLLDGDLQVFLQASTQNKKASYEVTTRNVSLKAYGPLLMRNMKDMPFDKWPLSTSFYMVGEAQQVGELKAFFKFKNFEAVGENMRLDFPEMNFEILNGHSVLRPFQVTLNHLPLAPVKAILAEQYDFQSVESLGVMNGLLKYEDHKHWSFDGEIQKTELIFSNRGSREIELIDSVAVNLAYKADQLNFKLDNLTVHQNQISGGLEGEFVKDPLSLQLSLDIEGQVLNEKIWKQLTQVSQNPSVKLVWNYKKTNEERHQIKISSPEMEFQGFKLADVQIDFMQLVAEETRSLALSLKTSKAEIRTPELNVNISKAFFNEETGLSNAEVYTALKTQIGMQGSNWKNMNFDLDTILFDADGVKSLEHLKAKGEWRSDSSLSGVASLQNPRRTLKYNLLKKNKNEIDFVPEKKVE